MKTTKLLFLSGLLLLSQHSAAQTESTLEVKSASNSVEYDLKKSPKLFDNTTDLTATDGTNSTQFSKTERIVIRINYRGYLQGDMNNDNKVTITDLPQCVRALKDDKDEYHEKVTKSTIQLIQDKLLNEPPKEQ